MSITVGKQKTWTRVASLVYRSRSKQKIARKWKAKNKTDDHDKAKNGPWVGEGMHTVLNIGSVKTCRYVIYLCRCAWWVDSWAAVPVYIENVYCTQECCHCCNIGIMAREAGLPCSLMVRFGAHCDAAFRECCDNGRLASSPTSSSSSSSSGSLPSTGAGDSVPQHTSPHRGPPNTQSSPHEGFATM